MLHDTLRPKILITNDDGIASPGIRALWSALVDFADTYIAAPAYDQSGTGLGITFRSPLQIEKVAWEGENRAWKINGTPADCVKLGLSVLMEQQPHLIVSGINRGANLGRTVLYSGTAGGVIEGTLKHISGIAFSFDEIANPDYEIARAYIPLLVRHVLEHPLPVGTFLNVNFPANHLPLQGIRMARQGRGYTTDNPSKRIHPEGSYYYWLGDRWVEHEEEKDSDVALLRQGYITVVPIHIAELTDHLFLKNRQETFDTLFANRF